MKKLIIILMLLWSASAWGADSNISSLTNLASATSDDLMVIVDGATTTKKITWANVSASIPQANSTQSGLLDATNFTTFTNKGSSNFTADQAVNTTSNVRFNSTNATFYYGNGSTLTGLPTYTNESTTVSNTSTINLTKTTYDLTANINTTLLNAWNGKVDNTTYVNTTSPLTGGGNLTANLALNITVLKDLVTTAPLTGGTNDILVGADADITIAIPQATAAADGYLNTTDWATFNNSVDTTRYINTTSPLEGGGNLSADRAISLNTTTLSLQGQTKGFTIYQINNTSSGTLGWKATKTLTFTNMSAGVLGPSLATFVIEEWNSTGNGFVQAKQAFNISSNSTQTNSTFTNATFTAGNWLYINVTAPAAAGNSTLYWCGRYSEN